MTTPTVAFKAVNPNLIVRDIERSRRFYCDVLGFSVKQTVPDAAPFVFVWLERGRRDGVSQRPGCRRQGRAVDGGAGVRRHRRRSSSSSRAWTRCTPRWRRTYRLAMSLRTQFYGMREFAVYDPDGHLLTFAERVAG